jgi:hypothetical protein
MQSLFLFMCEYSFLYILQRGWSRSRTLSVSYAAGTTSPLEPRGSTTQVRSFLFDFNIIRCFIHILFYVCIDVMSRTL